MVQQIRLVQIAKANKTEAGNFNGTTLKGERVFSKTEMKAGDTAIVTQATYTQRTDDNGQLVDTEPWTRTEATFVGNKADAIKIYNGDALLNLEAKADLKAQAATLQLTDAEVLALVNAL